MPQDYQIIRVTGAKEWTHQQHGKFIDYYLDVQGVEESLSHTKKPTSDEPRPGDTIYGHIEVFNGTKRDGSPFTAYKLKADKRDEQFSNLQQTEAASATHGVGSQFSNVQATQAGPQQGADAPPAVSNASSPHVSAADSTGDTPEDEYWVIRNARIERQHSQEMALRAVAQLGGLQPDDFDSNAGWIKQWTDHFCKDLDAYERARFPTAERVTLHYGHVVPPKNEATPRGGAGPDEGGALTGASPDAGLEEEIVASGLVDDDDIPF